MSDNNAFTLIGSLLIAVALTGCGDKSTDAPPAQESAAQPFQKELQTRLIKAKPGDVIEIPAGTYTFNRALSLNVSGVTIKGAGMDKTVLSFKGQKQGAEGLLVNASDFVIRDIAIEDTQGDALKINEGKNISIINVRTEWTNGPDENNGAYGIYPVQSENILIDGAVTIGASDAGIYVGQSKNIVVRNSRAEYNVAGIEIENSTYADVYDNLATNNTGGILVFDLPNLPVQGGKNTRVFNNRIIANNTENFAPEGNIVASVPAGTGLMINSNDNIEVFGNEIADNKTTNLLIISYLATDIPITDKNFDPYPETIYVHDNHYSGGGDSPDNLKLKALRLAKFGFSGTLPDIMWDGHTNPEKQVNGRLPTELGICIQEEEDVTFANMDAPGNYADISTDRTPHRCQFEPLAAIQLPQDQP